ncbi:hypothetical protein R1A27_09470 [Methylobacterium sp. NMS12]
MVPPVGAALAVRVVGSDRVAPLRVLGVARGLGIRVGRRVRGVGGRDFRQEAVEASGIDRESAGDEPQARRRGRQERGREGPAALRREVDGRGVSLLRAEIERDIGRAGLGLPQAAEARFAHEGCAQGVVAGGDRGEAAAQAVRVDRPGKVDLGDEIRRGAGRVEAGALLGGKRPSRHVRESARGLGHGCPGHRRAGHAAAPATAPRSTMSPMATTIRRGPS